MKKKKLTTKEAAKRLGVCTQRITARIKQGQYPNAFWCECGRSILIPEEDLENPAKIDRRRK